MPNQPARTNYPYPDKKLTKNSNGLLILHFAVSLRKPFTVDDISMMSPKKFSKGYVTRNYLKQLVDWKLINQVDEQHYQINNEGRLYVDMVASYYAQWNTNRAQLGRKKSDN